MTERAHNQPDAPAGQPAGMAVSVLTDGLGRFYVPVFLALPDGTAVLVGVDVHDELEAALAASGTGDGPAPA